MNTLKTVVVVAVLAIVGYGLYIGLNNGFHFQNGTEETPDWIKDQIGPPPGRPGVDFGAPGPPAPNGEIPDVEGGFQAPQALYPSTYPPAGPGSPTQGPPGATGAAPGTPPGFPTGPGNLPSDSTGGSPNTYSPTLGGTVPPAAGDGTNPDYPNPERAGSTGGATTNSALDSAIASARAQLQQGRLATALLTLSIWYEDPRLQPEQNTTLTNLLDEVAGTVIYSRKHLIEPSYRVRPGEQLSDIAANYNVPAGLLAKINGITNPDALTPGQELKVIRGPFNAVVNSKKGKLTLWVGGRYAGRFSVTLGPEFQQIVGPFVVQEKTRAHSAHNNSPWISLGPGFHGAPAGGTGQQLGIGGIENASTATAAARPGRIGVSPKDAADLFDILSQGSKVTIQR